MQRVTGDRLKLKDDNLTRDEAVIPVAQETSRSSETANAQIE